MSGPRCFVALALVALFTSLSPVRAADRYRLVVSPATVLIAVPGEEIRLSITAQVLRDGKGTAWQNTGGMKVVVERVQDIADGTFSAAVEPARTTAMADGTLEYKFKVRDGGGLSESLCFHLLGKETLALQNVLAVNVASILVLSPEDQASLAKKFGDRSPKQVLDEAEKKVAEILADANADSRKAKLTQLADFIKAKSAPGRNVSFEKVNNAQKELLAAAAKGMPVRSGVDLPAVARWRQAVAFDAADHLKKMDVLGDPGRPLIADLNNKSEAQLKRLVGAIAAANSAFARELVKALGDKPEFPKLIGTSLTIGVVRKGEGFSGAALSDLSKGGKPVACELVVRYDFREYRKPVLMSALQQIGRLVGKRTPKSESLAALSKQALDAGGLGADLTLVFERVPLLANALESVSTRQIEVLTSQLAEAYQRIAENLTKQ